jgi:hypothetical protein
MSLTCAFCSHPGVFRVRYRTQAGFAVTQITCCQCEQAIDRWVHAPVTHSTEEHLRGHAVQRLSAKERRRKSACPHPVVART